MNSNLIEKTIIPIIVCIISILFIYVLYITFKPVDNKTESKITEILERAYFEGQKDALEGDIRIKKIGGKYSWIKSPWDSNTKPIFKPELE
jgi:uncharacterized membrane protein YvbJ